MPLIFKGLKFCCLLSQDPTSRVLCLLLMLGIKLFPSRYIFGLVSRDLSRNNGQIANRRRATTIDALRFLRTREALTIERRPKSESSRENSWLKVLMAIEALSYGVLAQLNLIPFFSVFIVWTLFSTLYSQKINAYLEFMTTVAMLLGGQNITTTKLHVRRVLEFEKKLAQVCEGLEIVIHEMVDRKQQGIIYRVTSMY